jgi:hypothetical protein
VPFGIASALRVPLAAAVEAATILALIVAETSDAAMSAVVKGFGCRPLERQRGIFGGRCPKASKEGNRA